MQTVRPNTTLELLRSGKVALGTWLQLGSYHATRLLAAQGCFDWMLLDLEHNPIDAQQASFNLSVISDSKYSLLYGNTLSTLLQSPKAK